MVVTSLNLLPCGRLEGGRIAPTLYGRNIATLLSFGTSLLFGIGGLSGSVLCLAWGLFATFFRGGEEIFMKDEITPLGDDRYTWGLSLQLFISSRSSLTMENYTLPDLLGRDGIGGDDAIETISLNFVTSLDKDLQVYVYGPQHQPGVASNLLMLCLGQSRFVPSIKFVFLNNGEEEEENGSSSNSSKSFHESEVFEFWKVTKDNLALPLLIELCDKTGLAYTSCFMRLPTDIKLKILEFLSDFDIAVMACISSELKHLCLNNDLLEQKVEEEFTKIPKGKIMLLYVQRRIRENEKLARERRLLRPYSFDGHLIRTRG
ncbi:F-box domain [Macleaya cordata]|uniref:F-box domain n=1 Tax=Macleaya cordata TaxID=56857 RepID=A0A200PSL5_MACCD|nr:F-box domain [Macleaya cordata]